jgi:hypothetical protein
VIASSADKLIATKDITLEKRSRIDTPDKECARGYLGLSGGRAHSDTEIDGDNNSEVNEVNV